MLALQKSDCLPPATPINIGGGEVNDGCEEIEDMFFTPDSTPMKTSQGPTYFRSLTRLTTRGTDTETELGTGAGAGAGGGAGLADVGCTRRHEASHTSETMEPASGVGALAESTSNYQGQNDLSRKDENILDSLQSLEGSTI